MADVVEGSKPIANENQEPDTSNTNTSKVDTVMDEAPAQKTNGEDHKDERSSKTSEHKNEEFQKTGERKDNDRSSRGHKDRGKYNEPWKHDRYHDGGRHNGRGKSNGRGRGGRGRGDQNRQSQRKSRYDQLEESSDPVDIRNQVEFYFTDSNLPTDKFLLEKTGGHRNYPVDLKLIHSFARMQHFKPYSAVLEAVKASEFLHLNDKDEITRVYPLDQKFTDDVGKNRRLVHGESMDRSIYAKGFGEEREDSQIVIEQLFQPYGKIRSCRLRRVRDSDLFKGSVFVEFQDEETAQAFLAADSKPQYNGKDLEIMSKQAYVDKKASGIRDGTVRPHSPTRGDFGGRGRGRGRGGSRRDSRDWKAKDDTGTIDADEESGRGFRGGKGRGGGKGKDKKFKRGGRGGGDYGRPKRARSEDIAEYSGDDREVKRRRRSNSDEGGEDSASRSGRSASPDGRKRKRNLDDRGDDREDKRRRRSHSDEHSEDGASKSGRSASPDGRKRKRSLDDRGDDDVPTRAEAEAKKVKLDNDAATAGAEKVETSGGGEMKEEVEAGGAEAGGETKEEVEA